MFLSQLLNLIGFVVLVATLPLLIEILFLSVAALLPRRRVSIDIAGQGPPRSQF